jgi:hypothetical protein
VSTEDKLDWWSLWVMRLAVWWTGCLLLAFTLAFILVLIGVGILVFG